MAAHATRQKVQSSRGSQRSDITVASSRLSHRIADQQRIEQLRSKEIPCFAEPDFDDAKRSAEFLAEPVVDCQIEASVSPGAYGLAVAMSTHPLLSPECEVQLFRKYNYLRWQCRALQAKLRTSRRGASVALKLEQKLRQADAVRNRIVQSNLRLVVSLAKSMGTPRESIDDYVSESQLPLIRAVELFDYRRGLRFSTYATWAIRHAMHRHSKKERLRNARFQDGLLDPQWTEIDAVRATQRRAGAIDAAEIRSWLEQLDDRERGIVEHRLGLADAGPQRKFREIAARFQLSTERVRQLFLRATRRLRQHVEMQFDTEFALG